MAFAAIPLIGFAGIAIDVGYAQVQTRNLASATDAAALAGTRVMVTGNPQNGDTVYPDNDAQDRISREMVRLAIVDYLNNNIADGAAAPTIVGQARLIGVSPQTGNADQCLSLTSNGANNSVDLGSATANDLASAMCLRVTASITFNTFFVRIVGRNTFTAQATSTVTAVPVTAAANVIPFAVSDTLAVPGNSTQMWGPSWNNDNQNSRSCTAWKTAAVPHVILPSSASDGNCNSVAGSLPTINLSNYKGLISLLGPPNTHSAAVSAVNTAKSSSSGCHWHNNHLSGNPNSDESTRDSNVHSGYNDDDVWRGWNNPPPPPSSASYLHTTGQLLTVPAWDNSVFRSASNNGGSDNRNDCHAGENDTKNVAQLWIQKGFDGIISAGAASSGKGDFFTMARGDLGNNIADPFNGSPAGPCNGVAAGGTADIIVPLYDAFADPTNWNYMLSNPSPSVHITRFSGMEIPCPVSGSSLTGVFTSTVLTELPPGGQTGGHRNPGETAVTFIKLVQ